MAEGNKKIVLITGCSSGIGLSTAVLLAKDADRRFKVYATMRNLGKKAALEEEGSDVMGQTLFIEKLDVSVEDQISQVVDDIIKKEGKIDILVNNAGYGWFGPNELHDIAQMKAMFATNTFGPMLLTQKLLPHWKKSNSGRALTVTSVGGVVAFPFSSTYCATKFAMEGFYEALAMECSKFNIRFTLIEPGPVVTNFTNNAEFDNLESMAKKIDAVTKDAMIAMAESGKSSFTSYGQKPEDIAQYILKAITANEPNLRYMTNEVLAPAVKAKYTDLTGNEVLKVMKEMFIK